MTMYSDVREHMWYVVVAHAVWEPNSTGQGAVEGDMVHKGKSQGKDTVKAE